MKKTIFIFCYALLVFILMDASARKSAETVSHDEMSSEEYLSYYDAVDTTLLTFEYIKTPESDYWEGYYGNVMEKTFTKNEAEEEKDLLEGVIKWHILDEKMDGEGWPKGYNFFDGSFKVEQTDRGTGFRIHLIPNQNVNQLYLLNMAKYFVSAIHVPIRKVELAYRNVVMNRSSRTFPEYIFIAKEIAWKGILPAFLCVLLSMGFIALCFYTIRLCHRKRLNAKSWEYDQEIGRKFAFKWSLILGLPIILAVNNSMYLVH